MKHDPARAIFEMKQFGEFGDVNPSVTDSATYTFLQAKTMADTFHGEAEGCFLYSRHWNPSNKYLADTLAAMEEPKKHGLPLRVWLPLLRPSCNFAVPATILCRA